MRHDRLETMTGGWFVGDFAPSVLRASDFEVAVKSYSKGQSEAAHLHRVATEITVVVTGRVRMAGREWSAGDIVTLEPNEETDFLALTDALTVVVKTPSLTGDKYPTS